MDLKTFLVDAERGRASRLAAALGVDAPLISYWANDKRPPPADRCPAIEEFTGGAVTCEELRPDLTWVRVECDGWPNGKPLLDVAPEEDTTAKA